MHKIAIYREFTPESCACLVHFLASMHHRSASKRNAAMNRDACRERLDLRLDQMSLALDDSARRRLIEFVALLAHWNRAYNLTAVRDPVAMVDRHLIDALAVRPLATDRDLADIGTGPGIPGLVLALTTPYERVWLVDSNGKKARFLRECLRHFELPQVFVHECRVESLPPAEFTQVISRAYASLGDFIASTRHLLASDGRWLAMKGKAPNDELAQLPPDVAIEATHPLDVPGADGERCLVSIRRQPHSPA
jgi:16S rRNA (guanine527-N7)-methyltransferase